MVLSQTPLLYSTGDGALRRQGTAAEDRDEAGPDGGEADNGEADNGEADGGGFDDGNSGAEERKTGDSAAPETSVRPGSVEETGQDEKDGPAAEADSPPEPLREEPVEPQQAVDNGVRARTLIPSSPDGYYVAGRVYISSSRSSPLDVSALLDTFDAHLTGESPQILILHSHGSEAYTPTPGTEVVWSGDHRTTDPRYSVVKCGDVMAAAFAEAGISVLHDRTLYDYPEYTGSYDRSLAAINSYLAQYPSIHFILDVHRDSISDGAGNQYKVVSEIDGVGTAAQLTLVMGSDGSGAAHPDWMENLKLAAAIQEQISGKYPTLMRPILLRKSRYNQHATTGSLLVEVGASGNAPEEAQLAARLFAEEMAEVLLARTK
ncbi:MAG: stage II sporulation protein P [Oscillibacter sp.]|nr:stage II sporulation protein P [Oscillibacter sp.]